MALVALLLLVGGVLFWANVCRKVVSVLRSKKGQQKPEPTKSSKPLPRDLEARLRAWEEEQGVSDPWEDTESQTGL